MIVLFALIASSFAQVPCTQSFFKNVKERAANYAIANKSETSGATTATVGAAAASAKGVGESFRNYGQMHLERQAAFSQVYRGGAGHREFVKRKLYGQPIYPAATAAKIPVSLVHVLKRLGFQALIALDVYFYMNPSPARCNATLEGTAKTQEISGGRCVDKLALSENTIEFLSRPLAEQEKFAAQFPSVCEFYKNLYPTLLQSPTLNTAVAGGTALR